MYGLRTGFSEPNDEGLPGETTPLPPPSSYAKGLGFGSFGV